MPTASAPATIIRSRAAEIIGQVMGGNRGPVSCLAAAGAEVLGDVLIALEARFGIDLDPDEVWAGATVEDLADLVAAKVAERGPLARPGSELVFIDHERALRRAHAVRDPDVSSSRAVTDGHGGARLGPRPPERDWSGAYCPPPEAFTRHDLTRLAATGFWIAVAAGFMGAFGYAAIAMLAGWW